MSIEKNCLTAENPELIFNLKGKKEKKRKKEGSEKVEEEKGGNGIV